MNEATLRLLEVAGSWLSGVGTLLAVVVSLHLARQQTAIKLAVRAGLRIVVTPGEKETPEFVAVRVVNLGQQPVIITSVGWRWGIFRKQYAFQTLHQIGLGQVPPIQLTTGQEANFFVPLDRGWMKRMAGELDPNFPKLAAWMMRVQVSTSVGKIITRPLEPGLRKKLAETRAKIPNESDKLRDA
ncbi:hypothetical protein [Microvirga sp. CF3016]|uniref:hypothetical protein n=1 Tax=Microvirga sp. CF3016 TaxID=3110181 RepID=UPI002E7913F4|nr:hypothetical protein [Microvirga sp. CF3016]MEE1611120.1 hypothetical protein [Microvirga sp. CF3016]